MTTRRNKQSSPSPIPPVEGANVDLSGLNAAELAAYQEALLEPVRTLYWKPEREGEFVTGTLERVLVREVLDEKSGELKEERSAVLTRDGKPPIRVGMLATLLRAFHELDVRDGSRLMIVYRGEGTAKPRQSPPKFFKVRVLEEGAGAVSLGAWTPPEPDAAPARVVRRKPRAKKGGAS